MNGSLRILLVDDDPDARALVMRELGREFPQRQFRLVTDLNGLILATRSGPWDLVVTEHRLGWGDGLTVLAAVKDRWPDCPVIMFTGSGNEEIAARAMRAGVDDYVLKSPKHYSRLAATAILALEKAKQRHHLREAESRCQTLFNRVPVGLFSVALDGRIIEANPALAEMLGYSDRQDLLEVNARSLFGHTRQRRELLSALRRTAILERVELQLRRRDGKLIWVEINARAVQGENGRPQYCEGSAENITTRKRAEAQLRDSREQLRALAAHLQSVREEERTRLARQVQQRLGQALDDLKLKLDLLHQTISGRANPASLASIRRQLKTLPETVDPLIAAVRKIKTELRPAVLDDLGLEAAIQWQVHEFEARTGIKCEFNSRVRSARLDPERATALFRILQETLIHIVRRARATQASIHLREAGDKLVLEIQNNGSRLGKSEVSRMRSLNLLGIRERATMFDGTMSVVSRPGKGTLVDVQIPIGQAVTPGSMPAHN